VRIGNRENRSNERDWGTRNCESKEISDSERRAMQGVTSNSPALLIVDLGTHVIQT